MISKGMNAMPALSKFLVLLLALVLSASHANAFTSLSSVAGNQVRINPLTRLQQLLEECARANPDARIRPLTHASVDRAYQAESVGSNSLVSILIAIRHSPNL